MNGAAADAHGEYIIGAEAEHPHQQAHLRHLHLPPLAAVEVKHLSAVAGATDDEYVIRPRTPHARQGADVLAVKRLLPLGWRGCAGRIGSVGAGTLAHAAAGGKSED